MAYIGVSPSNGVRQKHTYTATASQTTFSGAGSEGVSLSYRDSNYVDVYRNGVKLGDADYTATSGTSIVLGEGAAVSDIVEIVTYDVFSVADTVSKADGGVFDGNVTMAGTLGVTGVFTGTSLDISGDIDVDGTTNLDAVDIDGAVDIAGNLSVDGGTIKLDGNYPVAGHNVALGNDALSSGSLSGSNNVALGSNSLASNTSGAQNIAIGRNSLDANSTGLNNVAVGHSSLTSNASGGNNVGVGRDTLSANTASNNTAVGYNSMQSNTTGQQNTSVGAFSVSANTTGEQLTAIGYASLNSNTTAAGNTGVGHSTLTSTTTGANNTATGFYANLNNTTGGNGVSNGYMAGRLNTTGDRMVSVGYQTGYTNTTGSYCTFVGAEAGHNSNANSNTFIGQSSGLSVTSGANNTIIGRYNGNSGGLDIRTSNNNIVLSDGDGNVRGYFTPNGHFLVGTLSDSPHTSSSNAGVAIRADGGVFASRNNADVASFNRNTSDGTVVQIMQAGTQEGTISVSGTTVSYNGGHLARWSRLLDNSKDTSIVKGTVMTNLDEMVEWGDEDNEQLNKMAVSTVEGDANVAGVFVNWDDDDDWNDMNVAMTGDMVIRIAQGTTVARGDLLMSAGDGTAKPQGDDIVRSKTIAKVTSTNVSHTYDDGTYLVPCVLMAC